MNESQEESAAEEERSTHRNTVTRLAWASGKAITQRVQHGPPGDTEATLELRESAWFTAAKAAATLAEAKAIIAAAPKYQKEIRIGGAL